MSLLSFTACQPSQADPRQKDYGFVSIDSNSIESVAEKYIGQGKTHSIVRTKSGDCFELAHNPKDVTKAILLGSSLVKIS